MKRIFIKLINRGLFDDSAHVHHGNDVTGELDNGKVMCNEKIGKGKLLLKVLEEVENLGLY